MKTFYLTFGMDSPLAKVLLKIKAKNRSHACECGATMRPHWCDAYQWDEATAAEKAKQHGYTIVGEPENLDYLERIG